MSFKCLYLKWKFYIEHFSNINCQRQLWLVFLPILCQMEIFVIMGALCFPPLPLLNRSLVKIQVQEKLLFTETLLGRRKNQYPEKVKDHRRQLSSVEMDAERITWVVTEWGCNTLWFLPLSEQIVLPHRSQKTGEEKWMSAYCFKINHMLKYVFKGY